MKRNVLLVITAILTALTMCSCSLVTDQLADEVSQRAAEEYNELVREDFGGFTAEIRKGWQYQYKDGFDLYISSDNICYYHYNDTTISDYYFENSIKKGPDVYVDFFIECLEDQVILDEMSKLFTDETTFDGNMYDAGYAIVHNYYNMYSYIYFLVNPIRNEIYTFIALYDDSSKQEEAAKEVKRLALSMVIKEKKDFAERESI